MSVNNPILNAPAPTPPGPDPPGPDPGPDSPDDGLSTLTIVVLAVVGSLIVLLLLIIAVCAYQKYKQAKLRAAEQFNTKKEPFIADRFIFISVMNGKTSLVRTIPGCEGFVDLQSQLADDYRNVVQGLSIFGV